METLEERKARIHKIHKRVDRAMALFMAFIVGLLLLGLALTS